MEGVGKIKDEKICIDSSSNQIVHVRDDSDSELQLLFDCVLKPSSQMPLQKPFKMRNLPASFFTPPAHRQSPAPTITHSREGSADSTYSSGGTSVGPPPHRLDGTISPITQPQHSRHHSSPATLQQTLSVAQPILHIHAKQHSCDALSDDSLPTGWEQARTGEGQMYYLNHITQTTTWEDPRKKVVPSPLTQSSTVSQPPPHHPNVPSPNPSSSSSTPVPSPVPPGISSPGATASAAITQSSLSAPLPTGWEQGVSPDGELYFINHGDKTTTWFDPRLPRHLQTAIGLKNVLPTIPTNQTLNHLSNMNHNGMSHSLKQGYQNMSLQKQQYDKDKLRYRMEMARSRRGEFAQRRALRADGVAQSPLLETQRSTVAGLQQLRTSQGQLSSTLPILTTKSPAPPQISSGSGEINLNSASLSLQNSNSADPFIATDIHSRQESADSGLGLGGNYTHPHTPEDFLASMEDVEITSVDDMQHSAPSPMIVGNSELESMDSEELVPSISINDDFLTDMLEPSKMNFHTWL